MTNLTKEKQKLVARIRRIRGQVDSIERSLSTDDDCAAVLMLLANVRGGINGSAGRSHPFAYAVHGERFAQLAGASGRLD
jgi:hypothetical protein